VLGGRASPDLRVMGMGPRERTREIRREKGMKKGKGRGGKGAVRGGKRVRERAVPYF